MFCEVMATTNNGMPMLIVAAREKLGVVHTGVATSRLKPLKSSRPMAPERAVPTTKAASTEYRGDTRLISR
ncbi:hypothetical protein D3C85_1881610 [compost metagenome]